MSLLSNSGQDGASPPQDRMAPLRSAASRLARQTGQDPLERGTASAYLSGSSLLCVSSLPLSSIGPGTQQKKRMMRRRRAGGGAGLAATRDARPATAIQPANRRAPKPRQPHAPRRPSCRGSGRTRNLWTPSSRGSAGPRKRPSAQACNRLRSARTNRRFAHPGNVHIAELSVLLELRGPSGVASRGKGVRRRRGEQPYVKSRGQLRSAFERRAAYGEPTHCELQLLCVVYDKGVAHEADNVISPRRERPRLPCRSQGCQPADMGMEFSLAPRRCAPAGRTDSASKIALKTCLE